MQKKKGKPNNEINLQRTEPLSHVQRHPPTPEPREGKKERGGVTAYTPALTPAAVH